MNELTEGRPGQRLLMMGNQAIARGALEAGVSVAAGYPGTPSSEIIENLAGVAAAAGIYVEWSVNEKVAAEVAAAASFAGLRSLCVMKQNGVNVASDFLLHLAGGGTRGGMVLVPCDDPGALSSINEGESRHFARLLEIPLLEPGDFQEAKDMIKWAFELSEQIGNLVMVRSVTRLSHASGNVELGPMPDFRPKARFRHTGFILDPRQGAVSSAPVAYKHDLQQQKLEKAQDAFENALFNTYTGPENPELLVITASACNLYCREAIEILGLSDRAGLLKLATTWPLPNNLVGRYLEKTGRVLIVEEVIPFLEENIKILAAELALEIGAKTIHAKRDKTLPSVGEMHPDHVIAALAKIFDLSYEAVSADYTEKAGLCVLAGAPGRDLTFCPGCPHRASYWILHNVLALDNREGFVCGDIGCYSLGMRETGYFSLKTMHAMGSGTGLASGFGKLGPFGMDQSIVAVSGDSTFFHAVMPALVNAVHYNADITLVVFDNSGTAMTGFQPHPGLETDAMGQSAPAVDIEAVCRALGAQTTVCDPFEMDQTRDILLEKVSGKNGVQVVIMRRACALSPARRGRPEYEMYLDPQICIGENCGCNKLCTRVFKCPGLNWDDQNRCARIDEVICAGCGVCASVCPAGAITRKKRT
ncbi:MAG: 4Fe-4S binding protein [Desulfobacteraceae bacterium]|nr:4Fe-4S binding protein [Desulfobacteraceae bacterium]